MQALISVFAILGVAATTAAADARLTLLPYAYLANPLPVYHQSQDTRAGVHAYSYAGGPSAKEEVRGFDGVTRGSYSYVDAHGILQSVFYVADEGGFRVAATNLPTDGDPPLANDGVLLARYAYSLEHARAAAERKEVGNAAVSRRKRSLEAPADQDRHRTENPSSQGDQADQDAAAIASPKSSHELPAPEEKSDKGRANRDAAVPVLAPAYGPLNSVLIPSFTGAATSHQAGVHNNVRSKATQLVKTVGVPSEPVYETVILPSQVPLATSHQSRVQVHNGLRVEVPEKLVKTETLEVQPQVSEAAAIALEPLVSGLPDYNENRIQLHKYLGLEGPNRRDAVKIDAARLAIVGTPVAAVPLVAQEEVPLVTKDVLPVVTKEALPVVTAVSSQRRTQIHHNTKLEVAVPIASEPAVYLATAYAQPIATWSILAPVAQSSQYRHQIHSSEKLELGK